MRKVDYDQILTDVSAFVPDGIIDLSNPLHVKVLKEAMHELGYDAEFINEYADNAQQSAIKLTEKKPPTKPKYTAAQPRPKTDRSGETGAAKQARQKGLEHIAFNYYGKDGKVMFKSSEDKSRLEKLSDEEQAKAQASADKKSGKTPEKGASQPPTAQPQKPKPNIYQPGASVELTDLGGVRKKANELGAFVKKIPFANAKDKQIVNTFIGQMASGDLSMVPKYKDVLNKYIHGSSAGNKMYLAIKEPGNFKNQADYRQKIRGIPKDLHSALVGLGIEVAGGRVSKTGENLPITNKTLTAGELFKGQGEKTEVPIKYDANGLTIGKHTQMKLKVPEVRQLVESILEVYKAKGDPNPKESALRAVRGVRRRNRLIDELGKKLTENGAKTVSLITPAGPGVSPETPQGRAKIIGATADKLAGTIKKLIPNPTPAQTAAIKGILALKTSKNIGADSLKLMQVFKSDEVLKYGASDAAEMFTYMRKLQEGKVAYLPGASNLPLADIVAFEPTSLTSKSSPKDIVNNIQQVFVGVDYLSIKVGAGGAGTMRGKIDFSEFKSPDTKKELTMLQDTAGVIFNYDAKTNSEKGNPATAEKLARQIAKKHGIDVNAIVNDPSMKQKVDSVYKRNLKPLQPNTPERRKLYYQQLQSYYIVGSVIQELYNNDLDYQLFFNERYAESAKGFGLEVTDGVDSMSFARFNFDSGSYIAKSGKPANLYPAKFTKEKPVRGSKEK